MTYLFHYDRPAVADQGDEIAIQTKLRRELRMLNPKVRLVAVPNGANRTEWEKLKASREGMARGFPDLVALAAPGLVAFLEIKAKTGPLSDDQVSWLNFLYWAGFPCGCFRSVGTAIAFLKAHGFPLDAAQAA